MGGESGQTLAASGVPSVGIGCRGFASADSDATLLGQVQNELAVCQEAGAVCASDYNFCYGYVKSEQKRLGVENE